MSEGEPRTQVSVGWDTYLDESGAPGQCIHLEKVDPTSFSSESLRVRPLPPAKKKIENKGADFLENRTF